MKMKKEWEQDYISMSIMLKHFELEGVIQFTLNNLFEGEPKETKYHWLIYGNSQKGRNRARHLNKIHTITLQKRDNGEVIGEWTL